MYDSPEITQNYTPEYPQDSWQQPIWLAFLASLGIHAILGINLPNISLFSQQVKLPPTVGLVELTPEQISRLPQPKTEPEISFTNIQPGSDIFQIPQQQQSFPRLPSPPTTPSISNLPLTSVGRSSYEIPVSPSQRPTVPLRIGENVPSSVSRMPRNQTPVDNNFSYYIPPPSREAFPLPTYRAPLENINPPSLPSLPELPEENQGPTNAEIRRSLNLNDDVYESGLFAQNPSSDSGNSTSTEFKGSLLEGLRRPSERYQDKVATTPTTAAEPEPTKINRLPESPLARQIREEKTRQQLVDEPQQPEPVAAVTPQNQEPVRNVEPRENPPTAPKVEPQREFKGSLLEALERAREQRQPQIVVTPEPKEPIASPPVTTPKPPTPTPTVAATPKVEPSPVRETAPKVQPSPEEQPQEEFKGSLLANLERDRQPKPEVVTTPSQENSAPPKETVAAANNENPIKIEVPTAEFQEKTPPTPEANQQQGEFKGSLLAKLEQYRRQKEQMDAAGERVFSAAERLGVDGMVAYTEWAIALGLEERNFTSPTNISNVYPDAACSENLTGKALVGVLVNADGEIIEGPQLLLASGRDLLDEAALSAVSDRSFETSDKSKAYQFAFSFNSSSCGGE